LFFIRKEKRPERPACERGSFRPRGRVYPPGAGRAYRAGFPQGIPPAGWRGGKAPFKSRASALLLTILFLTLLIVSFHPLSPQAVAAGGVAPSFQWPARGAITCPFSPPRGKYGAGGHAGIDIALARGNEVRASADGMVSFAGGTPLGLCVSVIHEGGFKTTYVSLGSVTVRRGQDIAGGQVLGTSDGSKDRSSSSPHLHFGMYLNGVAIDPMPLLQGMLLDPSESLFLGPWEDQGAVETYFANRGGGSVFDWLGRGFSAAGRAFSNSCKSVWESGVRALGAAWRWTCRAAHAVGGAFAAFYRTCIDPWLAPLCSGVARAAKAIASNRYVQAVVAGLAAAAVVCLAVVGVALLLGLSLVATITAAVVGSLAAIGYGIYYAFTAGDSFSFGGCFLASLSVGVAAAGTCLLLSYLAPLIGGGWSSLGWLGFGKAFFVHGFADSLVYSLFCLGTGRRVSPMGVLASFIVGGATGGVGKLVTVGFMSQGAAQALAAGWFASGGALLTGGGAASLSTLARAAVTRWANKAAYVLLCGCTGLLGDVVVRGVSGGRPSLAESLLCFGGGCLAGVLNLAGSGEGFAGIVSRLSGGRLKVSSDLLKALASKSFSKGFKEGSSRLLRWLRERGGGRRESLWQWETGGET
jgi:hypothetical protein